MPLFLISVGKITLRTFLFCLLLGAVSCAPENEKKTAKTSSELKPEKNKDKILLNNRNVEAVLTEYGENHSENIVVLHTSKGSLKIRLYEDTPLHRANFLRLTALKYFDGTVFHRVIPQFMIQGGSSDVRNKVKIGAYTIPPEILPHHFHKKGALAMARDEDNVNPGRRSDAHDFYIVRGEVYDMPRLNGLIKQYDLKLTSAQKSTYLSLGGAPHLDGTYTVFGEVVEGLEIIDQIANVKTDKGFWPLEEIGIRAEIQE